MPLLFLDPNGDVTQRLTIFLFTALARDKRHFRARAYRVGFVLYHLPLVFLYLVDGFSQIRAHPRRYPESDKALWAILALRVAQPVHQFVFVTGRITPVI